jgi:hypothetical protein
MLGPLCPAVILTQSLPFVEPRFMQAYADYDHIRCFNRSGDASWHAPAEVNDVYGDAVNATSSRVFTGQ